MVVVILRWLYTVVVTMLENKVVTNVVKWCCGASSLSFRVHRVNGSLGSRSRKVIDLFYLVCFFFFHPFLMNWDNRCLFLCLHFEIISDPTFSNFVGCGKLLLLFRVDKSGISCYVLVGGCVSIFPSLFFVVMFLSFSHMYVDIAVLFEYFLLKNERSRLYFLCLNVPSV